MLFFVVYHFWFYIFFFPNATIFSLIVKVEAKKSFILVYNIVELFFVDLFINYKLKNK